MNEDIGSDIEPMDPTDSMCLVSIMSMALEPPGYEHEHGYKHDHETETLQHESAHVDTNVATNPKGNDEELGASPENVGLPDDSVEADQDEPTWSKQQAQFSSFMMSDEFLFDTLEATDTLLDNDGGGDNDDDDDDDDYEPEAVQGRLTMRTAMLFEGVDFLEPRIILETIRAKDFHMLGWVYLVMFLVAIAFSVSYAICSHVLWNKTLKIGGMEYQTAYEVSKVYLYIGFSIQWVCLLIVIYSFVGMLINIALTGRENRFVDQIFVVCLLFFAVLDMFPVRELEYLLRGSTSLPSNVNDPETLVDFFHTTLDESSLDAIFAAVLPVVWFGYILFRCFFINIPAGMNTWRYFVLEMVAPFGVLASYLTLRIIITVDGYVFLPSYQLSIVFCIILGLTFGVGTGVNQMSPMTFCIFVLIFFLEILLFLFAGRGAYRSLLRLMNQTYASTRTKRLMLLFFGFNSIVFTVCTFIVSLISYFGNMTDLRTAAAQTTGAYYFSTDVGTVSFALLATAFVTCEAYMTFPITTKRFPWCIWHKSKEEMEKEKRMSERGVLIYSIFPPKTRGHRIGKAFKPFHGFQNIYVLSVAIDMMNCCFLAYEYGTPNKVPKTLEEVGADPEWKICKHICDEVTDTNVIILETKDRIVVAFRGTKSGKNLVTDINAARISLRKVFARIFSAEIIKRIAERLEQYTRGVGDAQLEMPGYIAEENICTTLLDMLSRGKSYLDSIHSKKRHLIRVHKGFAAAYERVGIDVLSEVARLFQEKQRAVFFTGHSLGGALANLAAFHTSMALGLDRGPHFVGCWTFGSPRVLNEFGMWEYKKFVPVTWTHQMQGDPITRLPPFLAGFRHVGNEVLLTRAGELIVDPLYIEKFLTGRYRRQFQLHRLWSYLVCFQIWVEKRHPRVYDPMIWNVGEVPIKVKILFPKYFDVDIEDRLLLNAENMDESI